MHAALNLGVDAEILFPYCYTIVVAEKNCIVGDNHFVVAQLNNGDYFVKPLCNCCTYTFVKCNFWIFYFQTK